VKNKYERRRRDMLARTARTKNEIVSVPKAKRNASAALSNVRVGLGRL
jgi:hypothetical protein